MRRCAAVSGDTPAPALQGCHVTQHQQDWGGVSAKCQRWDGQGAKLMEIPD